MMPRTKLETLHFEIRLVMNKGNYTWSEPRVEEDIEFTIPLNLFNEKNFSTLVQKHVQELVKNYPEAVEKWEAEHEDKGEDEEEKEE
jgi:hypothetical protein